MDDEPLGVFRDPGLTPAQDKLVRITREFKEALATQGHLGDEAHARVSDFKAAVLDRMHEELKQPDVPRELNGWWRYGKRMAWLVGYDKASEKVWRAMMRQESWSHALRNPGKVQKRG